MSKDFDIVRRGDGMSNLFVDTKQGAHAFVRFDELLRDGWQAGFCQALLLLGPARSGKTHLVHHYLRSRFPTWDPDNPTEGPVLMMEIKSGATPASVSADLLEAVDDPNPQYGNRSQKLTRVAKALKNRTRLIVFDEVQRLIDADTLKVQKKVAGWLTDLLNKKVAPALFIGEQSAQQVFDSTDYMSGRTRGNVPMRAYVWTDNADRKEFITFLYQIETGLKLSHPAGLAEAKMAFPIYCYSRGLLGMASRLIGYARTVAMREGVLSLLPSHFETAADELMVTDGKKHDNPFRNARLMAEGKG